MRVNKSLEPKGVIGNGNGTARRGLLTLPSAHAEGVDALLSRLYCLPPTTGPHDPGDRGQGAFFARGTMCAPCWAREPTSTIGSDCKTLVPVRPA